MGRDSVTAWFTTPETTPRATCPNEVFVRFVAKSFKPPAAFLDIGSGSGANTKWLRERGYDALSLDASPNAEATFTEDINGFFARPTLQFDCIFDINTLCHVENPPYEAIYRALRPGGKFFSIHPADGTQADFSGKGFTRTADILKMRQLLGRGFMRFTVRPTNYWDGDKNITSWQIEADK